MNKLYIKNIEKLFGLNDLNKFEKYFQMYSSNLDIKNIKLTLPDHVMQDFNLEIKNYNDKVLEIDLKKYHEKLKKYLKLNDNLSKYYIDFKVYNFLSLKETNETLKSILKSFGRNNNVLYNFTSTSTGRLTTKEGSPNILTLPKKYRSIFSSKWKSEGSLLMVDFSSLEPRIAKKLTSKENYVDIYKEINSLTEDNLDRSVIKRAVISTLYGSNTSLDNISKEKTELLMNVCKEFFKYDSLIEKATPISDNGYRENYFGRPIWNANELRDNIIVNNYIQSTAVDVSLSCFYDMIQDLKTEYCRPIFIIHDAIIFDVHNDEKENFVNHVKQGYNCKELGYFPLECTDFMETTK